MNEQRGNVDELIQEVKALALLLEKTDRDTLADALVLAGPDVQKKMVVALAWAEFRDGADDAEPEGIP